MRANSESWATWTENRGRNYLQIRGSGSGQNRIDEDEMRVGRLKFLRILNQRAVAWQTRLEIGALRTSLISQAVGIRGYQLHRAHHTISAIAGFIPPNRLEKITTDVLQVQWACIEFNKDAVYCILRSLSQKTNSSSNRF